VAIAHAALLAADLGAKLVARNVVEMHVSGGGGWSSAAMWLEDPDTLVAAARERLGDLDGVDREVVVGPVREELAALSGQVDVMVCGSRHQTAVKRVMLGSTGDYLARPSACPLLVTPATDEERVAAWRELRDAAAV
jgi:nucleotide-binding universal stress UspA family protein